MKTTFATVSEMVLVHSWLRFDIQEIMLTCVHTGRIHMVPTVLVEWSLRAPVVTGCKCHWGRRLAPVLLGLGLTPGRCALTLNHCQHESHHCGVCLSHGFVPWHAQQHHVSLCMNNSQCNDQEVTTGLLMLSVTKVVPAVFMSLVSWSRHIQSFPQIQTKLCQLSLVNFVCQRKTWNS